VHGRGNLVGSLFPAEIGKQLLLETVAYAESNRCRRKILLNYFGEEYPEENCGNCDNCLHPKVMFDAREDLGLIIELIFSMKEHFKADHLANILAGVSNSIIKSYNHHLHELFGIGRDKGAKYWMAIIRQGLILHFLDKDIEKYGLLSVTETGKEFHNSPYQVMMARDRDFSDWNEDDDEEAPIIGNSKHQAAAGSGDPTLFAMLKDVRKSIAKRKNIPSFVIFNDPSLEDMSILYPITLEELKNCQGVGEGKAKKYGQEFIDLIAKYVEENEIIRPTEFVVKSIVNKSANKVSIIQNIDRKIPLDDIAAHRDMDLMEVIEEIEAIVASGTKLNIDYYIRQTIDEDIMHDIYDYFAHEAETDSVIDAMKELGPDYREDEVRLVRIKYISDVGN